MGLINWIKRKRELRAFAKRIDRANEDERRAAPANIARSLQQIESELMSFRLLFEEILKSTTSFDMTPALTVRSLTPIGLKVYVCNQCKAVHVQKVDSCFGCGTANIFSEQFLR